MDDRFARPRPPRLRRTRPARRRGSVLARAAGPSLVMAPLVALLALALALWDPCLRDGFACLALVLAIRLGAL